MAEIWQHIKQQWARYKAWQADPTSGMPPAERTATHHCANCGNDFTGNYCYQCGQRAGTGRITWHSIRQGVMELWGLGTRSLLYTLWQLIWRPGYLIGDYLRGRRQLSYPPIKMLVLVSLFAFVFGRLFGEIEAPTTIEVTNISTFFDATLDLLLTHLDWMMLGLTSLFIMPTYFLFRYSPLCTRHTLPEGFFVQVFISTLLLLLIIAYSVVTMPFDSLNDEVLNGMFGIMVSLVLFLTYKQLFGFGWWGTAWRVALVLLCSVRLLGWTLQLAYLFYSYYHHLPLDSNYTIEHCAMPGLQNLLILAGCFALAYGADYAKKKIGNSHAE